jgi:hypothetical protein
MNEELVNEHHFLQLDRFRQSEFITKHCAGIEKQIRSAGNRAEAEKVVVQACAEFEKECKSNIIRNLINSYIKEKLGKYWH